MKNILGSIGETISRISGFGLSLVLLYSEYLLLRESLLNFINPFMQIQALINCFLFPVTWFLILMIALGLFMTRLGHPEGVNHSD